MGTPKRGHDSVLMMCEAHGWPMPEREYMFAQDIGRRWRMDWAWPDQMIALEQEGGIWVGGRHTSGAGFAKDMEKYNTAASRGWWVFRGTPSQIASLVVEPFLVLAFQRVLKG